MLLMKNPGRVYTKVQIAENLSGEYFLSEENTVMVHISNLRNKIEEDPKNPNYLVTVRGLGYKMGK
jgi:DNA-binding response OmpR family regulator